MTKMIMIILMFAVIVVIHELGHFLAARLFKVKVNEFAVGMGPKLYSKQKGETIYSIRALPIGGFCSMEGEDTSSEDEQSLINKKPWQKLIIFAAGAIMNFILAWILFSVIVGYQGVISNQVDYVEPDSPMAVAGLQADDTILAVNGEKVAYFTDTREKIVETGVTYTFDVQTKEGALKTLEVMPGLNEAGGNYFGFAVKRAKVGVIEMFKQGMSETVYMIEQTLQGFVQLITGQVKVDQLAGIVGVVQITSEAWDQGMKQSLTAAVMQIVFIGAFLSANLGVFNLLPLPALDGGRIIFSLIEMIRRKPVDPEKEGMVHLVGIVLLMILMVVVLYNDIVRVIG